MFNLLRMDLRRLFQSRNFYIVLAVTAGLIVLVTLMASDIADPERMDAMEEHGADITESDRMMSEYIQNMSQMELIHETLGSGFLLVMTGTGVTLFVNSDFSSGFIKNICCVRPRRRDYVQSKVLLAGIYSAIFMVLSLLLMLLVLALVRMHPEPAPLSQLFEYAFYMWLLHWAFSLMALALVLLTRSTTLGITMSLVSGSGLTAIFFSAICRMLGWPPVEGYLLSVLVKGLYVPEIGIAQTRLGLICAAVWAAVYGVGSLLLMEKRDI